MADLVRGLARRSFKAWRASLKRQRLKFCEKLVEMIDWHWDGSATYCVSENKHAMGFVEDMNYKIRVMQRQSDDLRNEECCV